MNWQTTLYLNRENKLFGIDLHTLSIFYTEPYMEYSQNNFFWIISRLHDTNCACIPACTGCSYFNLTNMSAKPTKYQGFDNSGKSGKSWNFLISFWFDLRFGKVIEIKWIWKFFSSVKKKEMMSENTYTSLQHSQERTCRLLLSAKKRDGCWASWFNFLHQNLHTLHTMDKESLIENQELLKLMIISSILTT